MKKGLDWQIDLEDEEWESQERPLPKRRQPNFRLLLLLLLVVAVGLAGNWLNERRRLGQFEAELRQSVQTLLDAEHEAFLNGDGDLYFSMLDADPAWRAAQLWTENMDAVRAGYTVTDVELHGEFVWATVEWEENGRLSQRITFFEQRDDQLVHVPIAPDYWGNWGKLVHNQYEWGELTFTAADTPFVDEMAATIGDIIAEACAVDCVAEALPLNVAITPDFRQTAKPQTVYVPSPRLFALDEAGEINGRFDQQLRQSIRDHITPARIRFALPPTEKLVSQHLFDYEQAAADFMAANPHIIVELVPHDSLPADLTVLADFDGAAIAPTVDMIAAGLVRDLTAYASSDPNFRPTDYYDQAWTAAVWRDRVWFVPQTAALNVLFYDKTAYGLAEQPEPSWQWNWVGMEADMDAALAAQPPESAMAWGYLDTGRDSLFAYAFSESNRCQATCPEGLQPEQVTLALRWYARMVAEGNMMDVSGMDEVERDALLLNMQSAERQAVIWADDPVLYEYYFLLDPLGTAPFPGQDLFDGSTPLWVEGSFISAKSKRPFATWQWLVFLSQQQPSNGFRRIPVRQSIAASTTFWEQLPRDLADPMRAAFNDARPVTVEDQLYFLPAQITAVVNGDKTAVEAAQMRPSIDWFAEWPP